MKYDCEANLISLQNLVYYTDAVETIKRMQQHKEFLRKSFISLYFTIQRVWGIHETCVIKIKFLLLVKNDNIV